MQPSTTVSKSQRVIKFRGIPIGGGPFEYGSLDITAIGLYYIRVHTQQAGGFSAYSTIQVDPETVGQFTGLLDKNGKEIYDQEILSLWCQADPNDYEMRASVYWDDEQFAWCLKCYHPSGSISTESLMEVAGEPEFIESIGNVYENPNLLQR